MITSLPGFFQDPTGAVIVSKLSVDHIIAANPMKIYAVAVTLKDAKIIYSKDSRKRSCKAHTFLYNLSKAFLWSQMLSKSKHSTTAEKKPLKNIPQFVILTENLQNALHFQKVMI